MSEDYDVIFDPNQGFLGRDADKNIESLIASIINYAKHKKVIYQQNSPEKDLKNIQQSLKSSLSLLEEQSKNKDDYLMRDPNTAKSIKDKIVEQNGQTYISAIENIAKFRAKVAANDQLLQKYCVEYPKNPTAIRNELKTKIKDAVQNLRREISGSSPQTVQYRRMIEEIVVKFAASWESFKNSYVLNFCLRGGAGVGKTTFAKAVAKCIAAYGILSTDYIKLADKTDFIAQYLGQTVYKTSNTLYSSLEGVCFIDEAYAIGATRDYGGEFIDELTLFTQKFPGCICIIVAGYEKEMKKHFFDMNEGLYRRFPNNLELRPYDIKTINTAIVGKIASKLEISDIEGITKATSIHQALVRYIYMDMMNNADYSAFNLHRILVPMWLTTSLEKRNILKTYILMKYLGIPEGDLLPNQMGDVQNIVDKILMTQSVLKTGSVTYKTAFENINAFLAIRDVAKLHYDEKIDRVSLTTNGTTPIMFTTNVINPLLIKIYGSVENSETLFKAPEPKPKELMDILSANMNKLYTEGVIYLFSYMKALDEGREKIKMSTHVDTKFLQQEFLTLQSILKTNPEALLPYRGTDELEPTKNEFGTLEAKKVGTITIPQPKTIEQSCESVVPAVVPNDPANNDGRLPEPEMTLPTGTGDFRGFKFLPINPGERPPPPSTTPPVPPTTTDTNPFLKGLPEDPTKEMSPEEKLRLETLRKKFGGRHKKHGTYRAKRSTLHKTYRLR